MFLLVQCVVFVTLYVAKVWIIKPRRPDDHRVPSFFYTVRPPLRKKHNFSSTTPILLFRPRSALNNPLLGRVIYGTEADLLPGPADAGTWHGDSILGEADMAHRASLEQYNVDAFSSHSSLKMVTPFTTISPCM
ncbi:hypothetical protein AZE42_04940 [Rhizopogon vesiculosus]|uniref:Uncharacterized protein n=1 Tax=Rhizopogon vesiculosus TaxID=180088 RepID=A0A1J8QG62_9AGAM|nr:hypothetical protein AZE42_04940 [Rhizopogon vesiculosus]